MKWSRFPFQYSIPSGKYINIYMNIENPTSYGSFSHGFPSVFSHISSYPKGLSLV